MATQELEQLQTEQSEDIAKSWEKARLMRLDVTPEKTRVIVLVKGRVVLDYMSEATDEGDTETPTNAARTLYGDRSSEKALKKAGYRAGKTVMYNTVSREIDFS